MTSTSRGSCWSATASKAKNADGDHGEARREPVHVVEQVEGVRHADEPERRRAGSRATGVCDDLHAGAGREDDRRARRAARRASRAGGSERMSSTRPARKRSVAPAKMPTSCAVAVSGPASDGEPEPDREADVDADAADERRRGRAPAARSGARSRSCEQRERRSAQHGEQPRREARRAAARVLTGGEGSRAVLGLCLPAQAVPRLVRDDDGLRRSPPLPRAVREPLPPRFPGEVQGLGARGRLVARSIRSSCWPSTSSSSGCSSQNGDIPHYPLYLLAGPRVLDLLLASRSRRPRARWSTARS